MKRQMKFQEEKIKDQLVQTALSLGASDARVISSSDILVEEKLAQLCLEPRCSNYGLSMSCPPNVSGPSGFKELREKLKYAVVIRLLVPSQVLLSSDSRELGRFLYELVAAVEQEAIRLGYSQSIAFAGGSCKQLFCHEHLECRNLSDNGKCRHPKYARSSMSGYGVNVSALMKTCGWETNLNTDEVESGDAAMSWLAGLVMVG